MTDILSTNDSLFTKNDMIMTDNGYYANIPLINTCGADTSGADTSGANTVGGNKSYATDKVSDNYKNLAIPALYLYTINGACYKENDNEIMPQEPTDNEIMPDDLYNKLISLAELKPVINKKYTKNKKIVKKIKAKKTRRNK